MSTPKGVNDRLKNDEAEEFANPRIYRSLAGKLIYLTYTQPDICYVVNYLLRYMNYPSKDHFSAAKRVVRYLAGIVEYGLWFLLGNERVLEAYSDSDWGGCKSYQKSTTGMFFSLDSSPISRGSRK